MTLAATLDRTHARARAHPFLYRFALGTRLLLAMGFIPTGLVKLLGLPFTRMDPATDVGRLFDVLHQGGGLYWRFLGAVQLSAGILILLPATATLGAVIFFPFILNIHFITVSYGFVGTPFITGPMLLAAFFLLCWDYDKLRGVVFAGRYGEGATLPAPIASLGTRWEVAAYWIGAAAGIAFFLSMRFPVVPDLLTRAALPVGGAAALLAAVGALRSMTRPSAVAA
jgi:hypothetical protein